MSKKSSPFTDEEALIDKVDRALFRYARVPGEGCQHLQGLFDTYPDVIDPNAREANSGRTALSIAAQPGRPESIRFLLDRGADPSIRDARGVLPIEYAEWTFADAPALLVESDLEEHRRFQERMEQTIETLKGPTLERVPEGYRDRHHRPLLRLSVPASALDAEGGIQSTYPLADALNTLEYITMGLPFWQVPEGPTPDLAPGLGASIEVAAIDQPDARPLLEGFPGNSPLPALAEHLQAEVVDPILEGRATAVRRWVLTRLHGEGMDKTVDDFEPSPFGPEPGHG